MKSKKEIMGIIDNLEHHIADDFIGFNDQTHKYHIDNQLTVKKQCELAGIPAEQIVIDRTCTYNSPDGFSYRQDKQSGRHLCYILRKK